MTVLHIVSDSVCVHRSISDTLIGKARIYTRAYAMLIRRRLEILCSLVDNYTLKINLKLVRLELNQALRLTRVPQSLFASQKQGVEPVKLG